MNLKEQIENYKPFDEVLTRNNIFGHFSASAFVVNKEKNKMVVVYHNIFDGWIYPGGHADGEEKLLNVAIREVEEETGYLASDYKVLYEARNPLFVSPGYT